MSNTSSIGTVILAIALALTLWATTKAETIYLPLITGGKTELVHAYNNGYGVALRHGETLEVHCESGMAVATMYGGIAYVECR